MSDAPQGPGWWQASDNRWYPPPRPDTPAQPSTPPSNPDQPTAPPTGPPFATPPGASPDPYGGTPAPGMPTAPGTPNRTPLIITLSVIAAVAVVGLILVLVTRDSGDSDSDETTDPPTTTTDQTEPAPTTTQAAGPTDIDGVGSAGYVDEPTELGDDLVLLEYGASSVADSAGDLHATAGLVLENTGNQDLQALDLLATFYDENDQVVTSESVTVHVIQPGETLGIGLSTSSFDPLDRHIARVDIAYGGEGYRYDNVEEGTLEVSDVTTQAGDFSDTVVRFAVTSTYDYDLSSPQVHAIFRNSDGEIVAGTWSPSGLNYVPAGDSTRGEASTYTDLDALDVDPDETEVYVDSGYRHRDG